MNRIGDCWRWALVAILAALTVSACRNNPNTNSTRTDSGMVAMSCTTTAECQGLGVCVAGLCTQVVTCDVDGDCAADGKVCHSSRKYCVECERVDQCPNGMLCSSEFTCVNQPTLDGGTGDAAACTTACTDRNMCNADQVCKMGSCCPPPSRCRSPNDCPSERPDCNGATGQCFGGGTGCFGPSDCESQPGCSGGACSCEIQGAPPGVCRARPNECQNDQDCYVSGAYAGKFCQLTPLPTRCQDAAACTNDSACAPFGLVCDLTAGSPSNGRCINGVACPLGTECGQSQACVSGQCVAKNCVNTPSLCTSSEHCDTGTFTCVPNSTVTCTTNTECSVGFYCDGSNCQPGCRDAVDCPNGVCNSIHQCEFAMGGLCGPCTMDTDCPAGATCEESFPPGSGVMKCYESCNSFSGQDCVLNPMAMCIIIRCSCL